LVIKKRKVVLSQKARDSLRNYFSYLKREVSEKTALHVQNGILEKCKGLSRFSGFSKELFILDKTTEYRSVTKWNFLIIYKIENDEVWILNIIHTSRHPNQRNIN